MAMGQFFVSGIPYISHSYVKMKCFSSQGMISVDFHGLALYRHDCKDLSPGFGYTGIVVAMLAQLHPLGVIGSAFFVACIFVGADAMSRSVGVPNYIADVVVATSLLCMLVSMLQVKYLIRWKS